MSEMSQARIDALAVKGLISEMPYEVQDKVKRCAFKIRQAMSDAGEPSIARMAIALIGSELACKGD